MNSPPPPELSSTERAVLLAAIRRKLAEVEPALLAPAAAALPGGVDRLAEHLDAVVAVARHVNADRIEPYLLAMLEDLCPTCPGQSPGGACATRSKNRCVLFNHARPVMQAVRETLYEFDVAAGRIPAPPPAPTTPLPHFPPLPPTAPMFPRILIAVDPSIPAMHALRTGADLATRTGATAVALAHALHPPMVLSSAFLPDAIDIVEDTQTLTENARHFLETLHHDLPAGLPVEDHVLTGRPADSIVADAGQWHADLIVIGDRNRSAFAHFLVGSTADAVLRRAPCPVLVVREPPHTHSHATNHHQTAASHP